MTIILLRQGWLVTDMWKRIESISASLGIAERREFPLNLLRRKKLAKRHTPTPTSISTPTHTRTHIHIHNHPHTLSVCNLFCLISSTVEKLMLWRTKRLSLEPFLDGEGGNGFVELIFVRLPAKLRLRLTFPLRSKPQHWRKVFRYFLLLCERKSQVFWEVLSPLWATECVASMKVFWWYVITCPVSKLGYDGFPCHNLLIALWIYPPS